MNPTELAQTVISTLLQIPHSERAVRPTRKIPSSLSKKSTKRVKLFPGELSDALIYDLLEYVEIVLIDEDNLLQILAPVIVVGDIHGQFTDLVNLLETSKFFKNLNSKNINLKTSKNHLFLGDYVDRGPRSLETICLLFALKILKPDTIKLLRGNHECWYVNKTYGFYEEVCSRYSQKLWRRFTKVFEYLPVAAVIEEKIFCCHGGLSPGLVGHGASLNAIEKLPRPIEVPTKGLLCDLLWADPDEDVKEFGPNTRGTSYVFGKKVLSDFLEKYDFDLVCRGHQVVKDGHEFFHEKQLVTIFSAPDYCGFGNSGAYMEVDEELVCAFKIVKRKENKEE